MTTDSQQVWLTRDGYEQLQEELLRLVKERAGEAPPDGRSGVADGAGDSSGEDPFAVRRERDHRIRKLQQMLQDPIVGGVPPDDGIAEPGMVLTVSFADGGDEETFLLAEREKEVYPDVEICSPDSPLGRALVGAREGEQRRYQLPDGRVMTVTLKRAVPYGTHSG
ncbi:GreA/GreB family elongation factor [Pseudonocardia hierapolitana]|uniref:GreA/GreB family elongation factor n=1 Tax=Pseudonocardia hierapolitana TaxID=1128676 RepID=A0A561T057_9PSEU|nr:GreA/GreB family elongation factor [Pseudonocardia hierapolitana]TWF80465.1 GreA/GreB family elongation factor [Pseudonocardia hierapolitana]